MKLVFLGPPGAGKGTQAAVVCKALSIAHVSTGDMLRAAIAEGTAVGLEAKAYMDRGDLVPDAIIMGIIRERLSGPELSAGFIFDGFPRTLNQAEALDGITIIDKVINVNVDDQALIRRLSGRRVCPACAAVTHVDASGYKDACPQCGGALIQREDDKPDTIKSRLQVYHAQTAPLIRYYADKGLLSAVDGARPAEAVTASIMEALREAGGV